MRILLVGAGGVGTAFARIAARRPFAELVIADYDLARAQRAAAARDGYQAVQLDARDEQAAAGLLRQHRCDVLMNATAVPRPGERVRFSLGLRRARPGLGLPWPRAASGLDQMSERICWSTLVVFATGSAWRQSCSMTSR
jgi:threonine dehydrogenase-like Zn-dependent dehydrogenase